MEPARPRPTRTTATPARLLALRVALVVALLPWLVQPGVVQPDTKVDLVVSPWRYLTRSLDAWSTHSGFGELQNQAYGYLWPMGPFFGVLHSLGVPGWAAQRAWWSFILVVGFFPAGLAGLAVFLRRRGKGKPDDEPEPVAEPDPDPEPEKAGAHP